MKDKKLLLMLLLVICRQTFSQTYPTFGVEKSVTINGLTSDAMEPSLTADGNFIFFNSINDGITTSLYYAIRINDSTFNYGGALTGANETTSPRLDAVASSDVANRFYWTSLRNFPSQFDNCFYGNFNGTDIVTIGRLHGTFYIYAVGWLMMYASINYNGDLLYYTNGYFGPTYAGCGGVPCKGKLGLAQKQNDSTFNKLSNSDGILQNINDTNYVVYAPNISKDGLELYYTRFTKNNISLGTQIVVSVRTNLTDTFSLPSVVIPFSTLSPEATTLSTDQSKLYYHKKSGSSYKLFLRYKSSTTTAIDDAEKGKVLSMYPNPTDGTVNVIIPHQNITSIQLYNSTGDLLQEHFTTEFSAASLPSGIYVVRIQTDQSNFTHKLIKQ